MRKFGTIFIALAIAALVLAPLSVVKRDARTELPPDSLARAVETNDALLFDLSVREKLDVNARDADGRTALWIATAEGKREIMRRLLDLGADVDLADPAGRTPLMIAAVDGDLELVREFASRSRQPGALDKHGRSATHHAMAARQRAVLGILLPLAGEIESDLLTAACETKDLAMIEMVLRRTPEGQEWNEATRAALKAATDDEKVELVRLLLQKHTGSLTVPGKNTPLLAEALVADDSRALRVLLEAGADPNAVLPTPCDGEFASELKSKYLRSYVTGDEGVTLLMLAAGLGKPDYVQALLRAGAERNRQTARYKMLALYFAARTENWKCVQMLLGRGPTPEKLRVEISLAAQRATIFRDDVKVFETACSTGREDFPTPTGSFVITDKRKDHISSIYKVAMPYFMRLNCRDFGLHAGVVPNYPASHGCIRLPTAAAVKLFSEIPIGTLVTIN